MWGKKKYKVITSFNEELPITQPISIEGSEKEEGTEQTTYASVLEALKVLILKRKFYEQKGLYPYLFIIFSEVVPFEGSMQVVNFILFKEEGLQNDPTTSKIEVDFHNDMVLATYKLDRQDFSTKVQPLVEALSKQALTL